MHFRLYNWYWGKYVAFFQSHTLSWQPQPLVFILLHIIDSTTIEWQWEGILLYTNGRPTPCHLLVGSPPPPLFELHPQYTPRLSRRWGCAHLSIESHPPTIYPHSTSRYRQFLINTEPSIWAFRWFLFIRSLDLWQHHIVWLNVPNKQRESDV